MCISEVRFVEQSLTDCVNKYFNLSVFKIKAVPDRWQRIICLSLHKLESSGLLLTSGAVSGENEIDFTMIWWETEVKTDVIGGEKEGGDPMVSKQHWDLTRMFVLSSGVSWFGNTTLTWRESKDLLYFNPQQQLDPSGYREPALAGKQSLLPQLGQWRLWIEKFCESAVWKLRE